VNPAVLVLLGVAGLGFALVASTKHSRPSVVLILGDSHSEASWTFGGRLAAKLREAGLEATVEGNRGKGVRWYLDSGTLDDAVSRVKPDTVIVELGGNDAVKGYPEATYASYLSQFVDRLRAAGVERIIWLAPTKHEGNPASEQRRRKIAGWQRTHLLPLGVAWFDMHALTLDLPTRDGVHYDRDNYETWATRAIEGPLESLV
jgi:lysophospholipase L1-like esterase